MDKKKLFLFIISVVISFYSMSQGSEVFVEEGKFGLRSGESILIAPIYKKLIPLGDNSFIAQKNGKYGIVDRKGEILLDFKYHQANRVLGKYVKLKNYTGYGLYDEYAKEIVPQGHDVIELLPGGMLLVSSKYKYGVMDLKGNVLIKEVCDDIYTPKRNVMRIKYQGEWYEIEQVNSETLTLPEDVKNLASNREFKITKLVTNPISASKYSAVATADYSLKIFTSISPAYEATIDELMLSQGADAVSKIIKATWIPMFPFVYAKNYYKTFRNPHNGPLSDIKNNIKHDFAN